MTMINEQWPYLLEPGLRGIFFSQMAALSQTAVRPVVYNIMTSSKAQEHFLGVGGLSDVKEYKGAIEYDDMEQLWKTTFTPKEWVKGIVVERKLVDDDQYSVINQRARFLAMAYVRTMEKHGASVFNNAFSGSYLGADGVSLCSASHPLSPTNASVKSNTGTSALSYQSVVDTRLDMRQFVDSRGELASIQPDLIIHGPELDEVANAIVNTGNKPYTGDYVDNFVRRTPLRSLSWDLITGKKWFMVDSQLMKEHLLWIDRVPVEFAVDPAGDYNLEAKYRGYGRWDYGWSDYRWVYGHNVS
jgi:hypothetical protein